MFFFSLNALLKSCIFPFLTTERKIPQPCFPVSPCKMPDNILVFIYEGRNGEESYTVVTEVNFVLFGVFNAALGCQWVNVNF